jgi:transposase
MKAISQVLRERILDTVERGDGSLRQIAGRFLVSVSFITRLLQLYRSTGSLEPRPHGGGNPAVLGPEELEQLRELVRQQPDARLDELRQRLGVSCSLMTISRALRKLGLPRQKKIPRAQEQDRPDVQERRQEFCAKLAGVDPRRLVFVDESGANTAMTRTHGRAPVGQRVYTNTPGRWESITMTCGMRLSGVTAPLAFRGATNTDIFESYVEDVLVPELKPGDVVIWDNLKPHKSEKGRGNLGGRRLGVFLCKATHHQVDHRHMDHRLPGLVPILVMLAQAAIVRQPRERPLYDPAFRQEFESFDVIVSFDDLQDPLTKG